IVGDRDGDPMLSFVTVPEAKTVKNRVHLDVRPTGSMTEEVERVTALGGTVRGYIEAGGSFWTQMRDPEGNEFCILRGPDDGWAPDELYTDHNAGRSRGPRPRRRHRRDRVPHPSDVLR